VLHSVPEQGKLVYREGLLIGYRGYDQAGIRPRFPFGHGLGYTTWAYESVTADSQAAGPADDIGLTVVIRNTGPRKGREVVQAYVEPLRPGAGRPVRTLAAFAAATAGPGESAEVRLVVPGRAFARYDEEARAWVWPPGDFAVRIGRSSGDLRLSVPVRSLLIRTNLGVTGREGPARWLPRARLRHILAGRHPPGMAVADLHDAVLAVRGRREARVVGFREHR
ncbi:MAG: fibronectin type III-like domain-contianing protein, partial [Streptosporangiaceae bacterium]